MTKELYTRRSIPESMTMAWALMGTNIKRMTKALWLPAVVVMVLTAGVVVVRHLLAETLLTRGAISPLLVTGLVVSALLLIAGIIFLDAKTYKLLNEQTTAFCIKRTAQVVGITILVIGIALILLWAIALLSAVLAMRGTIAPSSAVAIYTVGGLLLVVVLVVAASPLVYALMKYAIEPATTLRALRRDYRTGWKNEGSLIVFVLLTALLLAVGIAIIALPSVLVLVADALSQRGMALGDAPGTPRLFLLQIAGTVFVTAIVPVILHVWSLCAAYYMYASIEARTGRHEVEEDTKKDATTSVATSLP